MNSQVDIVLIRIRSLRVLVAALVGLVGLALFDRIPDPPTVLKEQTLDIAKSCHAGPFKVPTREFSVATRWQILQPHPVTVALETTAPQGPVLTVWRLAGDSSPPAILLPL